MGDLCCDDRLCKSMAHANCAAGSPGGLCLGDSGLVACEMAAFHEGRLGFRRAARWARTHAVGLRIDPPIPFQALVPIEL